MREQTKAIRRILATKYDLKDFRFRYVNAKNYVDSSDVLKITCTEKIDITDVITLLNMYTEGIRVYRKGTHASVNGNVQTKIYQPNTNTFVDGDMLEFIEVG